MLPAMALGISLIACAASAPVLATTPGTEDSGTEPPRSNAVANGDAAEVSVTAEDIERRGDKRRGGDDSTSDSSHRASSAATPQPKYRAVWAGMTPGVWMRDDGDVGLCSLGAASEMIEWQRQDPGADSWVSLGVFETLDCDQDPADAVMTTPTPSTGDIREAATRLIAAPSGFEVQPPNLVSYVNADNIVYLEPATQTHHDVLLGFDVWIRAVPDVYEWDFGDGSELLVTDDPNQPYPNHSYAHVYREAGEYTITLTTGWLASYSFNGPAGPWISIDGYVTTVNESAPVTVRELRSRLVND